MLNERMIAVLKMNGYNTLEEMIDIDLPEEGYDEFTIEFEGCEYKVYTDEEADEAHYEYIENFIDELGIEGFTESFQYTILNNYVSGLDWFDEALKEFKESYVEDIKYEDGRLEEEMEEAGCDTEDEYIEYLIEQAGDAVEYFKFNFGEEYTMSLIKEHGSLDVDSIVEDCKRLDGRGHNLSGYDGSENEEEVNGETYYIYRTN